MTEAAPKEPEAVSQPDALAELIERLEKARGPDRHLDAAIALHVGAPKAFFESVGVSFDDGTVDGPDCFDDAIWGGGGHSYEALRYTASIDAALTLVPAGWGFKADCGLGYGNSFTVGHVGQNKLYDQPEGFGAGNTPAIALCIAALRAREEP
jgi:hypothetical protein